MECTCGQQYVGRTVQKLHQSINKHRTNIRKAFALHCMSWHISSVHQGQKQPYMVTPIDQTPINLANHFEKLKKEEMYLM